MTSLQRSMLQSRVKYGFQTTNEVMPSGSTGVDLAITEPCAEVTKYLHKRQAQKCAVLYTSTILACFIFFRQLMKMKRRALVSA